jgi:hypothetical protein
MVNWMSKDKSDTPAVRRPHAAIAYVGLRSPAAHGEFTPIGDIADSWTAYRHTVVVPPAASDNQPVYVAVGFGPPLEDRAGRNAIEVDGGMKIADGLVLSPGGLLSRRLHHVAAHPGFEQVGIDCVTVTVIANSGDGP